MNFTGTIAAQTISVGITAGAPLTKRLDLVIDGVTVSSYVGITGAGTFNLSMPSTPDTSNISIQINT